MNSVQVEPRVWVAVPQVGIYSETFIANHIRRLPWPVGVLQGRGLAFDESGRPIHRGHPLGWVFWQVGRALKVLLGSSSISEVALATFLRRSAATVVLAEYGPTGTRVIRGCEKAGVPVVVHFHGADAYLKSLLVQFGAAYAEMFKKTSAIVAVSTDMVQQLINLGAPSEKVHYIPYGVDLNAFGGETPQTLSPRYLAVGRFVEKKAPHLTLRAFSTVSAACPKATLTMVGDGPLLESSRQLAASLDLLDVVEFVGVKAPSWIAAEMKRSLAFVQHSIRSSDGDCEGTPNAILEAQASGLPVVATRHTGIKDVVVEGRTGYLVEEHDVDGMAERMILLARDAKLARQMGRAGSERIRTEFSLEKSLGRLATLLEQAAEQQWRK